MKPPVVVNAEVPSLPLEALRGAMEGAIPAVMATVSADGVPNVAYLSQVEYVDERHVALSFQFFNRTRSNVLATHRATLLLIDPITAMMVRLHVRYLRTEESGPLFERMKARLASIASHTGMVGVFRLRGSDIYEVERIEPIDGRRLPAPSVRLALLPTLRRIAESLSACTDLAQLCDTALAALDTQLNLAPSMLMLHDERTQRLFTVASRGYLASGIGSEVELGDGVIGVAARAGVAIRLGHFASAYAYARAMRDSSGAEVLDEIPFPGLTEPRSQMAVPLRALGRTLGVLFVESAQDQRFSHEDEDALEMVAAQLAGCIGALQEAPDQPEGAGDAPSPAAGGDQPKPKAIAKADAKAGSSSAKADSAAVLTVRYFPVNGSVFLGEDYLIKGVAGSIFWKLVRDYSEQGRNRFSNRELRLDASLGLPDVCDNLEARLILLQRRLDERGAPVRIVKTGRGRFEIQVNRPLHLLESS